MQSLERQCQVSEHSQYMIDYLCLNDQCYSKRKLCQICQHDFHKTHNYTLLKSPKSEINSLNKFHEKKAQYPEAEGIIEQLFTSLKNMFTKYKSEVIFKIECVQKIQLYNIQKLIVESFLPETSNNYIFKILEKDTTDEQLDKIIKKIRILKYPQFSNIPILLQSLQVMKEVFTSAIQQNKNSFQQQIQNLKSTIKEWSILQVQDYKKKIVQFENQQNIQSQKEKFHKMEQFKKNCERYGWDSLITQIHRNRNLQQIIKLELRGNNNNYNEPDISRNILGEIPPQLQSGIPNIQKLDLSCNNIKLIKNIQSLVHLNKLLLSYNLISSIQGLETLVQLKDLSLKNNQITKIKNLNTLTKLQSLFLQNNRILKIQNVEALKKLKRLQLGSNRISLIENCDSLESLQILNLQKNPIQDAQNKQQKLNLTNKKVQVIISDRGFFSKIFI